LAYLIAFAAAVTASDISPQGSAPLRAQALDLHGAGCKVCGDDVLHRLEVHHHLYPINLGQRRTNVATDLVVLCRNQHANAHETMDRSG
jgi:predicted HNH restriction endonuclease